MQIQLVLTNSTDCEIGRFDVEHDDNGPLILAALASNVELRAALESLEPGDKIEVIDAEAEWRA